jgi:predicted MFS family arabinose efflux permease
MQVTVLVLYVTRDLAFTPAVFGLALAAFGAGGVLGALGAARIGRRLGTGRAIIAGAAIAACGDALVALAGPPLPAFALLMTGRFLAGAGLPLYIVNAVSLRQTITPSAVLGRTSATIRWVTWGVLPIGALAGGLLGETLGLRGTLVVAALGSSLAALWVARSPVRTLGQPHEASIANAAAGYAVQPG